MEAKTETAKKEATRACKEKGCKREYRAKGYCSIHYKKWRRGELTAKPRYRICGEENCKKPVFKKNMCEAHFSAWQASKRPQAAAEAAKTAAPEAPKTEAPAQS